MFAFKNDTVPIRLYLSVETLLNLCVRAELLHGHYMYTLSMISTFEYSIHCYQRNGETLFIEFPL